MAKQLKKTREPKCSVYELLCYVYAPLKLKLEGSEISVCNTYPRLIAMTAIREREKQALLLEITFASLNHAVHLQYSHLYLYIGYMNSTNRRDIVVKAM